ncbi:MAG: MazG nucleotide pyrophosphohydrolase domain-containing protein [Dissulfurispiraceae bacterium]|jgi:NTP pyrophosphatase (non-canonical NTP hydrolase)
MKLYEAQETVFKLLGGIRHPRMATALKLSEEVGEVSKEIVEIEVYGKTERFEKLKEEMSDTLVCLIEMANNYGIDLAREFEKKIAYLTPRAEGWVKDFQEVLNLKRDKLD